MSSAKVTPLHNTERCFFFALNDHFLTQIIMLKITYNHLYKVCRGLRNLGTERAEFVAEVTGTDPMIWMKNAHAPKRARFFDMAVDALGIEQKRPVKK
jgi:hypothetical protein